ncbi:MAG: serine/threonine-protein phosphatase [Sphingobacteriales bacterium]|nr:MAG: serine/threonine-protein phosphatase [Sphingobacteriales bacterium]
MVGGGQAAFPHVQVAAAVGKRAEHDVPVLPARRTAQLECRQRLVVGRSAGRRRLLGQALAQVDGQVLAVLAHLEHHGIAFVGHELERVVAPPGLGGPVGIARCTADVAGHGVTSSLLTSWMAGFHGRAYTPTQLVTKLNDKLVAQNAEKHITLICGLLDLTTHDVEWCSAGHYPPPILLQPEQEPVILTTSSLPLGLTSALKVQTQHLSMQPGSQLIFCSDGALESFKGGLNEQFNQLIQILQKEGFKPPEHVPDDIAILSLSRI